MGPTARLAATSLLLGAAAMSYEFVLLRVLGGLRIGLSLVAPFIALAAVVGLGLGALHASRGRPSPRRALASLLAAPSAMLAGLVLVLLVHRHLLLGELASPLPHVRLAGLFANAYAAIPLVAAAFFLVGRAQGVVLGLAASDRRALLRAWAAGLAGSAAGALAPLLLLEALDPLRLLALPVGAGLAAAALWRGEGGAGAPRAWAWAACCAALLSCAALLWGTVTSVPVAGSQARHVGWSPYHKLSAEELDGRVVLYVDNDPEMFVPLGEDLAEEARRSLETASFLGYPVRARSALVIGAGGGAELPALLALPELRSLTAVELDPLVASTVLGLRDRSVALRDPRVRYVVAEGRSFVESSRERYDLIVLNNAESALAPAASSLVKEENYLYTLEGVRALLRRLSDDGVLVLALSHHFQEYLPPPPGPCPWAECTEDASCVRTCQGREFRGRCIDLACSFDGPACEGEGLGQPPAPADPRLCAGLIDTIPLRLGRTLAEASGGAPVAVQYFPTTQALLDRGGLDRSRLRLPSNPPMDALFSEEAARIEPATDSWPFFYVREPSVPPEVAGLALAAAALASAALAAAAREASSERAGLGGGWRVAAPLFALTGAGFLLVEAALMQSAVLALGAPYLAGAVVSAGLLLGAGLSALLQAARPGLLGPRRAAAALALLALALAALPRLLGAAPAVLSGLAVTQRCAAAVLLLLPLGALMGVPFPYALGLVREASGRAAVAAVATDLAGSGLGLVLALVVPLLAGYPAAYLAAAAAYLSLAALVPMLGPALPPPRGPGGATHAPTTSPSAIAHAWRGETAMPATRSGAASSDAP